MTDVKFGVGCSKNWDPEIAGVEATTKALEQIGRGKPKFLLIFSTIHYAKEKNGLKKLLYGCRSLVDKDVPSIGGTVTGFICPEGCHTRGVVVVAGSGDIDVVSDYGERVIYTPTSIGRKIGEKISEKLKESKKINKLLIELTTGPIEPSLIASPIVYNFIRYLYKKLPSRVAWFLRDLIINTYISSVPSGPGMEEDILYELSKYLKDWYIIGCSTFDDMKSISHYQFFNEYVLKSSVVALALLLDNPIVSETSLPLIPLDKRFKIKKGWKDFCIDLIDGHPASTEYLEKMGWSKDYIKAHIHQVTTKTFYYPLGFEEEGVTYAFPAGFFFGESIVSNRKIRKEEVQLFLTSAKDILYDLEKYIKKLKNSNFTFLIGSAEMLGIFGGKMTVVSNILKTYLLTSKYLFIFGAGEHIKLPNEKSIFNNFSLSILSILNNSSH